MTGRRARASAAILATAVFGTACGTDGAGSPGGETLDGGIDVHSSGVVLAHRANTLIQQNHDAQCALCPVCGGFSPGSDACGGALLDAYPRAKENVLCRIAADEREGRCLADAKACNDANQCDAAAKAEYATCPIFTGAPASPPTGC